MLKSKLFRTALLIFLTLAVLAGAGYARLLVLSHNTALYYEADELARTLRAKLDDKNVLVFSPMFCSGEEDCLEVRIANYKADPAVDATAVDYVVNTCDEDRTNRTPCRRNNTGLLRKVNLYFYVEPSAHCFQTVEIYRNKPTAVVTKQVCDARRH